MLADAVMGAVGGLATRLRLPRPLGRAGVLAASMWVGGVGAGLAFAVAAINRGGPGHRPVFHCALHHRLLRVSGGAGKVGYPDRGVAADQLSAGSGLRLRSLSDQHIDPSVEMSHHVLLVTQTSEPQQSCRRLSRDG